MSEPKPKKPSKLERLQAALVVAKAALEIAEYIAISPSALCSDPAAFQLIKRIDCDSVLAWFTGKARAKAEEALTALLHSAAQGYWEKGWSRKVRAAMNKQAVARKFAESQERDRNVERGGDMQGRLVDVCDTRPEWFRAKKSGVWLVHAMMFGNITHVSKHLVDALSLRLHCQTPEEHEALDTFVRWCRDFAPVSELCDLLDARRPPPKIAFGKTISPTVAKTLVGDSLKLKLETVRYPEFKWSWVTRMTSKGVPFQVREIEIIWPEGTVHGRSRFLSPFNKGRAQHDQCHACGHAIKNVFNWVPLVIDSTDGVPHSFWVGSDCARNVFGAEVEGDAVYKNRLEGVE